MSGHSMRPSNSQVRRSMHSTCGRSCSGSQVCPSKNRRCNLCTQECTTQCTHRMHPRIRYIPSTHSTRSMPSMPSMRSIQEGYRVCSSHRMYFHSTHSTLHSSACNRYS